jgi:hypothetical protein
MRRLWFSHRMIVDRSKRSSSPQQRAEDQRTELREINRRNAEFWANRTAHIDTNIAEGRKSWATR